MALAPRATRRSIPILPYPVEPWVPCQKLSILYLPHLQHLKECRAINTEFLVRHLRKRFLHLSPAPPDLVHTIWKLPSDDNPRGTLYTAERCPRRVRFACAPLAAHDTVC